jgi:hypothetical protein
MGCFVRFSWGKLASLESPTLEIPSQPCDGALEGRPEGLCVVKGDPNSMG